MDEKRNTGEFSLEDILKEFGDDAGELPEEDVTIWESDSEPEADAEVSGDTVRLDVVTKAIRAQSTVSDDTVRFTPVGEEEELPSVLPSPETVVEPYSEKWEPEYEQPISDYVPPEPIVFRPKNRLRELKRKLVAGPEKRYYELSEQGLGKLQLAILANFLVAVMSAATMVLYTMGTLGAERLRFVVFVQFLSLLLSALFGSYQLMEGIGDIFRGRFSLNSLLVFSLAACVADGVLCLLEQRVPCSASFSLNMTMSLWSAYQKRNTEMGQMDTMRKATRLDSLVGVADYHEGRPGFLRGEGQVEDFMDTYNAPAGPEKVLNVYALVALIVSVGTGVTAGVLHGVAVGIQAFAASLLVGVPATAYISQSRPMAVLERRMHKLGTVLCGWQGVKGLSRNGWFPVEDTDIFPVGTAKLNGVKFYGSMDSDEVVSYAAALMNACGGGMAPLFSQLLDSRNGYHYEAVNLRSYHGGVGAEVNGEAVLAGTLDCLQELGVEMPAGVHVSQAIYVAIDGKLCGVFALSHAKVKSAAVGLSTLCSYRGLTPVLVGGDFMLTESFLRSKFGINTRRIAFPERPLRDQLNQKLPGEGDPVLAMTTRDGLASMAYAITGARALRTACIAGVVVHLLGGILGLVMMLVLAILGAQELLTPMNLLVYELVWLIPGMLITEWTRSV